MSLCEKKKQAETIDLCGVDSGDDSSSDESVAVCETTAALASASSSSLSSSLSYARNGRTTAGPLLGARTTSTSCNGTKRLRVDNNNSESSDDDDDSLPPPSAFAIATPGMAKTGVDANVKAGSSAGSIKKNGARAATGTTTTTSSSSGGGGAATKSSRNPSAPAPRAGDGVIGAVDNDVIDLLDDSDSDDDHSDDDDGIGGCGKGGIHGREEGAGRAGAKDRAGHCGGGGVHKEKKANKKRSGEGSGGNGNNGSRSSPKAGLLVPARSAGGVVPRSAAGAARGGGEEAAVAKRSPSGDAGGEGSSSGEDRWPDKEEGKRSVGRTYDDGGNAGDGSILCSDRPAKATASSAAAGRSSRPGKTSERRRPRPTEAADSALRVASAASRRADSERRARSAAAAAAAAASRSGRDGDGARGKGRPGRSGRNNQEIWERLGLGDDEGGADDDFGGGGADFGGLCARKPAAEQGDAGGGGRRSAAEAAARSPGCYSAGDGDSDSLDYSYSHRNLKAAEAVKTSSGKMGRDAAHSTGEVVDLLSSDDDNNAEPSSARTAASKGKTKSGASLDHLESPRRESYGGGDDFIFAPDDGAGESTSSRLAVDTSRTPRDQREPAAAAVGGTDMFSPSNRKVPTPAVPTISPGALRRIGGKLYPDLRHAFIRRLYAHGFSNRNATWKSATFDTTVRAIVALSLWPHPIRSAEATRSIVGVGDGLLEVLKEVDADCNRGTGRNAPAAPWTPADGRYSAVAPAALVALLFHEEEEKDKEHPTETEDGGVLCSLENLIRRTNLLMDDRAKNSSLNKAPDHYLDRNTMDPAYSQIKKMSSRNVGTRCGWSQLIKERKRRRISGSGVAFELTAEGRIAARRLRRTMTDGPVSSGPLRQLCKQQVDEAYGTVTVSMDFREGGGRSKSLHKMCDLFDKLAIPYVVRELRVADYIFFCGSKLAPVLIERKTIDDVAMSLFDGRWDRQQRKMRKAQYVLGGSDRRCQICYLIEGADADRRTVHGGNVGRASWDQSAEDVDRAIESLGRLGFSVIRSRSHMDSINKLGQVARDVAWRVNNGSLDVTLTYEQFIERVNDCDESLGDAPTERIHQFPAPPISDGSEAFHSTQTTSAAAPTPNRTTNSHSNANILCPSAQSSGSPMDEAEGAADIGEEEAALQKLTVAELKRRCKDRDEKISGSKGQLIARLLKPRKPEILILRSKQGQYVPKVPSCNGALMVALLLNCTEGDGLEKDELMARAEECGVSKEPMDAKNGPGGTWGYDGFSGMNQQLMAGDPALVCSKRRSGKKIYCLTEHPRGSAGQDVARALHILAHREGVCKCGNYVRG